MPNPDATPFADVPDQLVRLWNQIALSGEVDAQHRLPPCRKPTIKSSRSGTGKINALFGQTEKCQRSSAVSITPIRE